ncbi:hypothetical protein SELMODRAFT_174640 [Selaginella moellendorffii]|uniref:Exportin-T n=1 Tax=Selaginella moellendorffii TaxID=88036 RepID=D8RVE5_SELML|nr:exportin-T [Selaginella moellendorffii]EFJ23763.1 hypothetical protein SELMODRAFT_174640 [Selaginella moellendorffii]|eukprot:XP_002974978.1 exportin-T [Selaginella moellendorffii]
MDDFEKAIFFSFNPTVDANLKAQATAFVQQAKQSPTIIQACVEKLRYSQYAEVQFWCLQALEEIVKQRYSSLASQQRHLIRSSLLAAVCFYDRDASSAPAAPPFIRNKLAQVVVLLLCIEYPSQWPGAFVELISFLSKGPMVVDMFCRILIALDEEVISLEFQRSPAELALATRIKDAMRQQCIGQIAAAWYNLVAVYRSARPDLAALVLEAMQRYVSWIDIGLVANESFIPLMLEILVSPQENRGLRGAAADCLLAVVSKRMDSSAKLALLRQLRLGPVCARLTSTEDGEFGSKLSALLTGFAAEILECGKERDTGEMLDEILPSVFYFMQHGDEDISSTTFLFLSNFVKSATGKQATHLRHILELIRYRMRYSADMKDALDVFDREGEEEEERMDEYRKELLVLFRSVYRVAPEVTTSFVKGVLVSILGSSGTPFEEVEAGITLLYCLGEGVPESSLKADTGDLPEMLGAILTMTVPGTSHRAVAIVFLETVIRYVKFVQHHEAYVPAVLGVFLDGRGIHHPNPNVSSKASYLFSRLVRTLRLQLLPYVDSILQSLQDTLCISAKKSSPEEKFYTFEAVGFLIGAEDLPRDKQEKYLSAVLLPLYQLVESTLASKVSYADGNQAATVALLQQIVLAINHFSKGFGEQLLVNSRPELGNTFKQSVDVVLRILLAYPRVDALRSKVISFLHRMVDILGSSVFPILPTAIRQLLLQSESKDLVEFIQLLNQLINKFKSAMNTIIQEIFPSVVDRVFFLLPKGSIPENVVSNTEEMRELQELQKAFFNFLHAVTSNDLSSVLRFQTGGRLNEIILLLLDSSCGHKDILVRKICVQVLSRLAWDWCGNSTVVEQVPGFHRFVIDRFAADCCIRSILQASFNLNDANTVSLLNEIASAQKTLYERCGEDFLIQMATKVLPAVRCPPNMAEEYCLHIQRSDPKVLKTFYRNFAEKLRFQYNSGNQ